MSEIRKSPATDENQRALKPPSAMTSEDLAQYLEASGSAVVRMHEHFLQSLDPAAEFQVAALRESARRLRINP